MSQASEAAIALVFNMRELQRELERARDRAYRRAASVIAGIILPDAYVPPVLRSPKQVALALKIAAELQAPKAPEVPQVPAPVSSDRVVFTGTIVFTKWQDSDYGGILKMLVVVDAEGGQWKAWGTVPAGLDYGNAQELKGRVVTLRAHLEPKRGEPSFVFLKRPTVYAPPAPKKPRAKKAPAFQRKARGWFTALQFDHGSPYREVRMALARIASASL